MTTLPWPVIADRVYSDRNVIHIVHAPTEEDVDTFVELDVLQSYDLKAFEDIEDLKQDLGVMKHSNTDGRITSINEGIVIDFNREMNGEWVVYEVEVLDLEVEKA